MISLLGWTSTAPGSAPPEALRGQLAAEQPRAAAGGGWLCVGPEVCAADGIAVALRGRPLWRTQEARVKGAADRVRAVLEAYRLWGADFLQRIHGGFAVAIFDSRTRATLLAVDRFGIERLCYAQQGAELWFGTSAEAVAQAPWCARRLDNAALLDYLFFHMVPSPITAFAGVRKLPPATVLIAQDGRVRESVYWQPAFAAADAAASIGSLSGELHAALETAVRAAEPDDTTGAFLSGGLDSSTVAAMLGRARQRSARTFSIGFGVEAYDELRYARIASARFGFDAREYQVRPDDIVELFPIIARAYDEPFGNASALPTLCCARLAREQGVTHLLSGDGGDEIFAGNKRYAEQAVFERYQLIPRPLRAALEAVLRGFPAALGGPLLRKGRSYVAQASVPLPARLETWNFLPRLGFATVLHPEFLRAIDPGAPVEHMRAVYAAAPPGTAVLDRMLYYDWRLTLADNDLRKVGTMCEAAGVRVSYPMLHPDVIDVSLRVPAALKMHGGELRA
ncbi:MAG TPA: asparagine synthase-related protein, partial [Steroidobacteraceae bacterium]|nr:asparagine synthase-related protein [Steroidobacteraceae bacterium]